jgi:peptide-methionine (S)-S-oxide reductase
MKHSRALLFSVVATAILLTNPQSTRAATAVFAGGCFWCMEQAFEELPGVSGAISGFTGGTLENPTYRGNHRGHYEAVSVDYDPEKVSYQRLLDIYWHNVDPFDDRGQFCDKGFSYRAAIFTATDSEGDLAATSLSRVKRQFPSEKVVTQILPAGKFWPVEEYHQDYYLKNPLRYRYYKGRCGRADRLEQLWGKK